MPARSSGSAGIHRQATNQRRTDEERVDHHQRFSTWMKERATGTIDIENKPRMVVADEAMTMLRDAFLTAKKDYITHFPTIVVTPGIPASLGSFARPSSSSSRRATSATAPPPDGRALPHGWERVPANAGHGFDGCFAPGTNQHVTACVTARPAKAQRHCDEATPPDRRRQSRR